MDDRTYRRMQLSCQCGHVARSASEEARHRHNFPMLCRKPKPPKKLTADERAEQARRNSDAIRKIKL